MKVHPSKLLCLCSRILVNIWTRSGRSCRLPAFFFPPKERLDFKTSPFVLKESRKSFLHQPVWKSRSNSFTSSLLICAVLGVCSAQQFPRWRQGFLIPFRKAISSSSTNPLENNPLDKQSPRPCCTSKGRLLVWFVPLQRSQGLPAQALFPGKGLGKDGSRCFNAGEKLLKNASISSSLPASL